MNIDTAARTLYRVYRHHDPDRTDTRADATRRTVSAWRAYCAIRAQHTSPAARTEARSMLRAIVHAAQHQHHKDPAAQAWEEHVTMPHNLYAFGRTPRPDEIQPESVNVWLRLIERSWREGITELDRRAYWRAAYAAHLAA